MDLEIIPLRVEFRVFAKIKLCIWKCFTITLFDKLLWAFQMQTIEINIFKYKDVEPDTSPPSFSVYDTEVDPINYYYYYYHCTTYTPRHVSNPMGNSKAHINKINKHIRENNAAQIL